MKTFVITIEIEHTDRSFERPEVQQFVAQIGSPQANWVKEMRKAFKQTVLGEKAHDIQVTYAIKEWESDGQKQKVNSCDNYTPRH